MLCNDAEISANVSESANLFDNIKKQLERRREK